MNTIKYTIAWLAFVSVAVLGSIFFVTNLVNGGILNAPVLGSVEHGSEYNSTQITSTNASSTATTQVKSITGTLGSVVVTDAGDTFSSYPSLTIYDATSTMATSTATVLAKFSTTTMTLGTYSFDTAFSYGLKAEVPAGFDGIYTLTWR